MNNDTIVVLDGARTPIGSFGGMFKDVPAFELGATAAVEALSRAKVDPADIREVVMGCIGQVGPDAYNARRVAVRAGLSTSVPAYTVNRLCGQACRRCGPPRWRCAGTISTSYSPVATSP